MLRKFYSTVAFVVTFVTVINAATWTGSGTDTDAYQITSVAQLKELSDSVNSGITYAQKFFQLTVNIELTENWTAIGTQTNPFMGTFDGGGKTIAGLTINLPTQNNVGLFGYTLSATIKNLGIISGLITGNDNVGAVVGFADMSVITNCYNKATVVGCKDGTGGLVGAAFYPSIDTSYNQGAVSGVNQVGGILGKGVITLTDIDGNVYETKQIGNQVWMLSNLKTTKLNDGTAIANASTSANWSAVTGESVAYTIQSTRPGQIYYAFGAVATNKLCPKGWHVPTEAEWIVLKTHLEGVVGNANIAKSMASTTGWPASTTVDAVGNNQATNNSSGLNMSPEGYRKPAAGGFSTSGQYAAFWSSTPSSSTNARMAFLYYGYSVMTIQSNGKTSGYSVRCVKN